MVRLHDLKKRTRDNYKRIGSIKCPILGETVYFTSEGFNHLVYKSYGRPRTVQEQFMKLKCFEHATSVLRDATLVKEVRKVRIKKKGKWKKAIQYGIVHEVKRGKRIRVVVEKIGKTGKHKFVSVMPEDNASKY